LSTTVLPVFLVGASSPSIRADLGLSETAVGAVVTTLFVSAALTATAAGRLVERIGAGVALRVGVAIAAVGAAVVGGLARGWWGLAVPLAVVGFAVALIDTGSARAFSDRVPAGTQGLAFGIKEASIPAASMLAGLSLPTVAATLGWRASFGAAAVVALAVLVALPSPRRLRADPHAPAPATAVTHRVATPAVLRFAAGVGLGTGAATAGATFLVPTVVAAGLAEATAGVVLSVASVASIGARIGVGRWADTDGAAPVPVVGAMLALGGGAAALLAVGGPWPLLVAGAVMVLGAGWGWTGLAFLAVVRANPAAPAAAAGVVLTGLGLGGALGPLAFGALADRGGFGAAWAVAAVALAVGAGLVASTRHALVPTPVGSG
jgi:MFS family permease